MLNEEGYNGTGSFRDYYLDNSFDQLTLNSDVVGPYTAANGYEYYGRQNGWERSYELAAEADGVNFKDYDNDGDGYVDAVAIVHAGPGAEEDNEQHSFCTRNQRDRRSQFSRCYSQSTRKNRRVVFTCHSIE